MVVTMYSTCSTSPLWRRQPAMGAAIWTIVLVARNGFLLGRVNVAEIGFAGWSGGARNIRRCCARAEELSLTTTRTLWPSSAAEPQQGGGKNQDERECADFDKHRTVQNR